MYMYIHAFVLYLLKFFLTCHRRSQLNFGYPRTLTFAIKNDSTVLMLIALHMFKKFEFPLNPPPQPSPLDMCMRLRFNAMFLKVY